MRGPIERALVLGRREDLASSEADIAVCYELPAGQDGLREGLAAQRELTSLLRELCGPRAESIPVFTASGRDGDGIGDCQTAWGATEVKG